jgi:hypothetical protein
MCQLSMTFPAGLISETSLCFTGVLAVHMIGQHLFGPGWVDGQKH